MILTGLLLLLVGYLLGLGILETLGIVLIAVGTILLILGTAGPISGRWY